MMLNSIRQNSFYSPCCKLTKINSMGVGKTDNQGLDVEIGREMVIKQGPCQ